jgi:hypothetical protein
MTCFNWTGVTKHWTKEKLWDEHGGLSNVFVTGKDRRKWVVISICPTVFQATVCAECLLRSMAEKHFSILEPVMTPSRPKRRSIRNSPVDFDIHARKDD